MTAAVSATIGGVSQWQLLDADFPFELAREATAELRVNRPYWLGDFYPLTKPSSAPEDWLAFQLHRQDLDEGIILAFRREQCFATTLQVLPRGLNPDGNYFLTLSDESRNRTNRQISRDGNDRRVVDRHTRTASKSSRDISRTSMTRRLYFPTEFLACNKTLPKAYRWRARQ